MKDILLSRKTEKELDPCLKQVESDWACPVLGASESEESTCFPSGNGGT